MRDGSESNIECDISSMKVLRWKLGVINDNEIFDLLQASSLVMGPTKNIGLTPEVLVEDAKQIAVLLNKVKKYEIVIDNDPNPDRVAVEQTMLEMAVEKLSSYEAKYLLRFHR